MTETRKSHRSKVDIVFYEQPGEGLEREETLNSKIVWSHPFEKVERGGGDHLLFPELSVNVKG